MSLAAQKKADWKVRHTCTNTATTPTNDIEAQHVQSVRSRSKTSNLRFSVKKQQRRIQINIARHRVKSERGLRGLRRIKKRRTVRENSRMRKG
jgi:hypothetical protein